MKVEDYEWYTPREMRKILEPYRGFKIPASTMRYWRKVLGMTPNDDGLYSRDDLQILAGAIAWLDAGKPLKAYAVLIHAGERLKGLAPVIDTLNVIEFDTREIFTNAS